MAPSVRTKQTLFGAQCLLGKTLAHDVPVNGPSWFNPRVFYQHGPKPLGHPIR